MSSGCGSGHSSDQAETVPAYGSIECMFDWMRMEDRGRQERIEAAGWLDTPSEPRFDYITGLMREVFKVPCSCITLLAADKLWCKSVVGREAAYVPRSHALCNFVCVPPREEVLVSENTRLDARFAHNPFVKGDPGIVFFAASPLVGAGGTRYGTLCVIDYVPRSFTAEMYRMLVTFAELAVQELETDQALLGRWTAQAIAHARRNNDMQACISTATEGVALVDTRRASWELKYANGKFGTACEETVEELLGKGFWHMFQPVDGTSFSEITDTVAVGGSRTVAIECCKTGVQFRVALHPAISDRLCPGKAVGLPSWVPSEHDPPAATPVATTGEGAQQAADIAAAERDRSRCADVERSFYIVVVQPASSGGISGRKRALSEPGSRLLSGEGCSAASSATVGPKQISKWKSGCAMASHGDFTPPESLSGLVLGPLLGSGSFGKVYRASWKSSVVAVKVVRCQCEERFARSVDEGKLGMSVTHKNVVKTVKMGAELEDCYIRSIGGGPGQLDAVHMLWIVQEYCNRGTLAEAVERGWMRTHCHIHAPPDMLVLYQTLKDIADGMAHVHAQGIVHCDLNGRNVMLTSSSSDSRGFVAKVADFGLARACHAGAQIEPGLFGTVSHLPPEQVRQQTVSPPGDVWAFGVTMWEVISGYRAHCGEPRGKILLQVGNGRGALSPPDSAPQAFKEMLGACMQDDPQQRPTFAQLSKMIEAAMAEEGNAQ